MARLGEMRAFAVAPRCRHRALVEYFGQAYEKPDCGACDVCLGEGGETIDGTVAARKILSCVARVKERFGAGHVVAVLRGAQTERIAQCGHEQLSTYGLMRDTDEKTLKNMVYQLLDQSLLERSTDGLPTLRLNAASWHVMRGERTVRFIPPQTRVRKARVDRESWEDVDLRLFEALRGLRREIADERRVPPFVIFSDATLRDLARQRPTEDETLRAVHGVGPRKAADFGERFCGLIAAHCAERGLSVNAVAPRAVAAAQRGDLPASGVRDTTAYSASRASASRASASGASAPGATGAKLEAWQMFAAGASVEEVMAATSRARSTTSGYLAEFIEQERPESIAPWVDDATYARVAGAITELDATTRMKPVFEHLGGEVPYDLIRLVFAHAGVGIAAPGT